MGTETDVQGKTAPPGQMEKTRSTTVINSYLNVSDVLI